MTPSATDLGASAASAPACLVNPVLDGGPTSDHGDPYVLEFLGEYFLYHSGPTGISVYRSEDLVTWTFAGTALTGGGAEHWAQIEFWAPEVLYRGGEFVMYVAATRHGVSFRTSGKAHGADGGDDDHRRQGVARSRSPLGPFVWDDAPLVDEWSIDGHLFCDADGEEWLFYNVRNASTRHHSGALGCGNVVDRVLPDGRLAGQPVQVAYPSEEWEGDPGEGQFWNEAPFTLEHAGRYVQMYSGGFYGGDAYSVGICLADSMTGPWHKVEQPVFVGGRRVRGPGHHCVALAPDGATPYAVYHGYVADGFGRKVHLDRLNWVGGLPWIGSGDQLPTRPTEGPQPVPPGPVLDPDVAPFHLRAWVQGEAVLVAGLPVALDPQGPTLVEASYNGDVLTVRRDGVRLPARRGTAVPQIVGGHVLHQAVTSRLEDESEHALEAGDLRSWRWGGSLPVTVTLAVQGAVVVRLGTTEVQVADAGGYRLVSLNAALGGEALTVEALGPVRVAGVVVAARNG